MTYFNSSETYDVLEGSGVRLKTFTVEPNQTAHLVMTHQKHHEPHFSIYRVAGKVCTKNCPKCIDNPEVVKNVNTLRPVALEHIITTPGTYYLHSLEAAWMKDPCRPVIIELFVS